MGNLSSGLLVAYLIDTRYFHVVCYLIKGDCIVAVVVGIAVLAGIVVEIFDFCPFYLGPHVVLSMGVCPGGGLVDASTLLPYTFAT